MALKDWKKDKSIKPTNGYRWKNISNDMVLTVSKDILNGYQIQIRDWDRELISIIHFKSKSRALKHARLLIN